MINLWDEDTKNKRFIYYAKKKSDQVKKTENRGILWAAFVDEGFYVVLSDNDYANVTIKEIEQREGIKAKKKTYNIGRKGQKNLIS